MSTAEPGVAAPDTGRGALWHLGGLLRIRAYGAATGGALAIVEEHARLGYRTPPHVHTREDEVLYIIDGELSYRRGEDDGRAGPGEMVFLPRQVAHRFEVVSGHAHFLNLVTPAGFEEFFAQVSGPALAMRIPTESESPPVDAHLMAAVASRLGVTILDQREPSGRRLAVPAGAAALALAQAGSPATRTEAYHRLARLLTGPAVILDDARQLIRSLNSLLAGGERWFEPRAALLLGITAERLSAAPGVPDARRAAAWQDLTDAVPVYAGRARQAGSASPSLAALYYLLAHFPARADLILRELSQRQAPEPEDHARLIRCLYQPDFTTPETLALIGRVWPSPAVWDLSATELEADGKWRAAAGFSLATARALWEAETTALLAFMGAKAEFALEEMADA